MKLRAGISLPQSEAWTAAARDGLLIAAFLFLGYAAAIAVPFAYHDDYYYFAYDNRSSFLYHPQYLFFLFTGRQLYVALATPMAALLWEIADFTLIRVLFLVALACAGLGMTRMLQQWGVPRHHALGIVCCVLVLPGFQVGVTWVTMAPFAAALLLSLLAAHCAFSVEPAALLRADGRRESAIRLAGAVVLLMGALFVYPPWAMFFVVMIFARTLFQAGTGAGRLTARLCLDGGILACACAAYYFLHKLVLQPGVAARYPDHYARYLKDKTFAFTLATDFASVAERLVDDVVGEGAKLWGFQSPHAGWWVGALLLLGAAASFFMVRRRQVTAAEWAARALALPSLSVACALPVLAAAGGHVGYRVLLPFSATLVMGLYGVMRALAAVPPPGARWCMPAVTLVVAVTALGAGIDAYFNVRATALNAHLELKLTKFVLADRLGTGQPLCHIHMVLTPRDRSLLGATVPESGEFNRNASVYWQDAPWMARAAMAEIVGDRRRVRLLPAPVDDTLKECAVSRDPIIVTSAAPGVPAPVFPHTLVIDLNAYLPAGRGR